MNEEKWNSLTPVERANWMHQANNGWGEEFVSQSSAQTWESLQRYAKDCIVIAGS